MDISLFQGEVIAIDPLAEDSRGVNVPIIFVKSQLDGAVLPIQWLPIGSDQKMPMISDTVLYYRFGKYDTRIICFYGNNGPQIRKGASGLNPGEAVFQSDSGLGFLKVSQDGSVSLVTGDMTSSVEGNNEGLDIKAPNITLETFGKCSLKLNEDGSILIQTKDSDGKPVLTILMKDENVSVEAKGTLSLKAKKILLDGEVSIGKGATEPETEGRFGQVVTSGPFGTHPFDFTTGSPIQGSGTVKVGNN